MRFLSILWGACQHSNYTFPQKSKRDLMEHVVCLDCSREFYYDWRAMKVLEPVKPKVERSVLAPETWR